MRHIKRIFIGMHPKGPLWLVGSAAIAIIFTMLSASLGTIMLILTLWIYATFRMPKRVLPNKPKAIISPADGLIIDIAQKPGPEILGMADENFTAVTIDCHLLGNNILRAPVAGTLERITRNSSEDEKPFSFKDVGKYIAKGNSGSIWLTLLDEGANRLVVEHKVLGPMANTVIDMEEGATLEKGQVYGISYFFAQTILYLPEDAKLDRLINQHVIGGETCISE